MDSELSNKPQEEIFRLFDDNNSNEPNSALGFLDFSEKSIPPPPPCIEVLASEVSPSVKNVLEPVNVGGLTLLKGRVSTQEVFALSDSDLVPGKYEGGLKLWEGSLDLITALSSELQNGRLSFTGKRVLELGCGHGLPGIYASLKGASAVHFQDFNAEVLQHLTIPNVKANDNNNRDLEDKVTTQTRFFAGDWGDVHRVIIDEEVNTTIDHHGTANCYYDVILMAETLYSVSALPNLYKIIKKCLSSPHGVVYMAAKKYYFGVGGGTRRFLSIVEKDGVFDACLIAEVADGSSNVREIWKLHLK